MIVRRASLLPLAAVLALAGCMRQRYPEVWGRLQPVAPGSAVECPALDGEFADVATGGSNQVVRLATDVFRLADTTTRLGSRTTVVQHADDSLVVTIAHADTAASSLTSVVRARRTLRRALGDYSCGPDGLAMASWNGLAGEGVLAMQRMRYDLRRAADGALVARERETVVGIVLLIPIAGRDELWYRFAPVGSAGGGAR